MAAATILSKKPLYTGSEYEVHRIRVSAMTSDQTENIAHGGPTGAKAGEVSAIVVTSPSSGDVVSYEWIEASDSLTNDTVAVKFKVSAGGDISGAIVDLFVKFYERASGGIS